MDCKNIPRAPLALCPKQTTPTSYLQKFFTEAQIEWIYSLMNETAKGWFEVETISELPKSYNYGFTRNGKIKKNSKYNLCISFTFEDKSNKLSGKQSSHILLVKKNNNPNIN